MSPTDRSDEPPLSNEEIETILAAENPPAPEDPVPAQQPHLVESPGSAATWVKWILFISLSAEFLLGWFRRK